ncbi:U32 family peptidase [Candidatus Aalborgicola defluviihabitans]|uniref:U32 family peptidase n=1 Tax=Candidatus Aalborgicola defluviihabitans TaxID=3386187 RepID=UPI001ED5A8B5|nr:U32 family peptidase [Burkholderiales bacterium]MBL0244060.1 U32 family peptidase [Rhodoferax sp.]
MKISLGPLQYYWQRDVVFNFYEAMGQTAVDVVYLGEAVCSRRHELRLADWLDIAALLKKAGKEVVLSTQVLLESGAEVGTMHKITGNGEFAVEANDMGAVQCLNGKGPFVAGPHLNIYNLPTLQWMAGLGANRWVIPLEMKRSDLAVIQADRPAGLETEVFAYGRMPLAFSARCFTARQRNLPKDDCRFSCLDHPDGLMLKTREHEGFLVLNGTQTQSAKVYNLVDALDDMRSLGVDVVRLSPQSQNMADVVAVFDAARKHTLSPQDALARLQPLMPFEGCNGYWHGQPGLDQVHSDALAEQD